MMCSKILAVIAVVVAVVLAALASFLPATQIDYVIAISRFFDIMIPVLAVGALIRYLCKGAGCGCCCGNSANKGGCSK